MAEAEKRILHVLTRMDHGGIEMSLLHLLRSLDRSRYKMDFLVLSDRPGTQDDTVRALGGRIIVCPADQPPWRFGRAFARVLAEFGPYDAVHSHVHFFGAYMLRLAARRGVPLRIAHSRNDTRASEAGRGPGRQIYARLARAWIRRYANVWLAVSRNAATDLFGDAWRTDPRFRLVRSGRDFGDYADPVDRAEVRKSLGLPIDALVLGHVGRFYWRKNHPFLIEIATALMARVPNARLLLIGDGPDRAEIETLVAARGLSERVVFAGARSDVPILLKGAVDVFVLPSHHEGLSMAAVEAQAAGLPSLVAAELTDEMIVLPELVTRLSLTAPAAAWAEQAVAAARAPRPDPATCQRTVAASEFSIARSVGQIQAIYDSVGGRSSPRTERAVSCRVSP